MPLEMPMKLVPALLISSFLSGCAIEAGDDPAIDPDVTTDEVASPTVERLSVPAAMGTIDGPGDEASSGAAVVALPITYHGGPVMLGPIKVYVIWYGNWTGNTAL